MSWWRPGGRGGRVGSAAHPLGHPELVQHLRDVPGGVVGLIDIDGLCHLNVVHGLELGQRVVHTVADALTRYAGQVFRLGGDEFAVVSTGAQAVLEAHATLHTSLQSVTPLATVSCGWASIDVAASEDSALAALQRAGTALAAAKDRGRGHAVGFHELDIAAPVDRAKAEALIRLLVHRRLRVVYQPIFTPGRSGVLGFEALARPDAEHGLSDPREAFAVAKLLHMTARLDEVCRGAVLGDDPGFVMHPTQKLFLNVHASALIDGRLSPHGLAGDAVVAGLDPSRVVLELGPSSAIDHAVFAQQAAGLAHAGFSLALDGVDGSAANLRQLRGGLFGYAKISGELVRAAIDDPTAAATLRAICASSDTTGLRLVAAGLEDAAMISLARSLRRPDGTPSLWGMQGYELAMPGPQPRYGDPSGEAVSGAERTSPVGAEPSGTVQVVA